MSNNFKQKIKAVIHKFLYPILENVSEMGTPLYIRSFKIMTPLGGTYPYG